MSKFRIRKRKQKQKIDREIPLRTMIPNLVTFMAAASGITSIRYASMGKWKTAVSCILIACVFDGLDGRVARMLRATSKLGAELDSLSDFVSFGVAPGMLVYFWLMQTITEASIFYPYRGLFWAVALFYALCDAFRLARFNIMLEMPIQPYWKHFFMGLPAPGGACLVMLPVVWQFILTPEDTSGHPLTGAISLFLCGLLLACRLPTLSAKAIRVPAKWILPVLLAVIFMIGMLVAQFWLTLACLGVLYYVTIPICGIVFCHLKKKYELGNAGGARP